MCDDAQSRHTIFWMVYALRRAALRDGYHFSGYEWHHDACLLNLAGSMMLCDSFDEAEEELLRAIRIIREKRKAPHVLANESIKPLPRIRANKLADEIQHILKQARDGVTLGRIKSSVSASSEKPRGRRAAVDDGDVFVLALTLSRWADANRRLRSEDDCCLIEDQRRSAAAIAAGHITFGDAMSYVHLSLAQSATAYGPGYGGTGGAPVRFAGRYNLRRMHRVFEIAGRYRYSPCEGS